MARRQAAAGPWVAAHLPRHRVDVEPFGGSASVLLRKPRCATEVWNDLDRDLVILFRVLRSARAYELVRAVALTPFARDEFEAAHAPADDPVERARRLVVRSFMGFGSGGPDPARRTGFRKNTTRHGTTPAEDWADYPRALAAVVERLRGVVVEAADALGDLARYDHPEALFYLNPPYLPTVRSARSKRGGGRFHGYRHELDENGHARLLDVARGLRGMAVLSGYPSPTYDAALSGWRRVERAAVADGARPRVEALWISPRAADRLDAFLPFDAGTEATA